MITSLIPSFNSGELSPKIHLRSDLDKYRSGCRTLQNMLITPFGGVERRPGLSYVKTANTQCRLFRFQVSTAIGYVMEFGAGYIRFYRDNGAVQAIAPATGDYQVATPYLAEHLAQLQIAQINSVAYVTHPLYPVYKLARIQNANWEFLPVNFSYQPMGDENLASTQTLTTNSSMPPGGYLTLTSSFPFFNAGHIGAHFQISHERKSNQFEVALAATLGNNGVNSSNLIVQGPWSLTTYGTWTGLFTIERSTDFGVSWQTIRQFQSAADANHSASGVESARVLLRLKWTHGAAGTLNPRAVLEASGAFIRGLVKVTSVNSSSVATAQVILAVEAGNTSYWREGAWSQYRGYPRTVVAHEQRLIFGGNAYRAMTVWGSAVDDFENFEPGVEDSDSWAHSMASDQQNDIQWLVSQKSLLIGTSGDEWVLASSSQEAIITPTNVRARRHSGNGSTFLKARLINDSVLFVQRGGRKLRDMSFSFESDGYVTTDLTLLAEHITGQGIVDTAYQSQPLSILWCVTRGGDLIGLTYDRAQNIVGWHRHVTGDGNDGFESVAVRTTEGESDQLWVVVRRTINGTVRRHIERFKADGFFLDTPWSLLYADDFGVGLWAESRFNYNRYDVRVHRGLTTPRAGIDYDHPTLPNVYLALVATSTEGTPHGNNPEPIIDWEQAVDWDKAVATGSPRNWGPTLPRGSTWYVYRGTILYKALVTNSWEVAGNVPGVNTSVWEAVANFSPVTNFELPTSYSIGARVVSDGKVYVCTSSHTPAAATRPGVGASWATKWAIVQGSYAVGNTVSQGGSNYISTVNHTPTDATRPGIGLSWDSFWDIQTTDNLIFYVDSGVTKTDVTLTEFTGLGHLEGETVQVFGNSTVLAPRVVSGGKILLNQPDDPSVFTDITVGLGYESILEPMALEVGMQNGTSVGREKRIHELVIYFSKTSGCKFSSKLTGQFDTLNFRTADMIAGDPVPLFTGPKVVALDARHDLEASFVIKQDLPLPMTILAVVPKFNVYGDQS